MKKILFIIFSLILTSTLFAQKEAKISWKELNDFHDLVSPVFHTAEKGNYSTAKDSSYLLLDRAQKLNAAPLPAGLATATYKPLTERLVLETKDIDAAVKAKKTDAELKPLLHKAHNTFHEILGKFKAEKH